MANGRGDPKRRKDSGRDPGGFVALPWAVLDSDAYLGLSPHAKALLLEVARQFHSDDNGRMLLSRAHLSKRGWASNDMIMKAKRELLDAELIFETVKGARPNKASWYAITWQKLAANPAYEFHAAFKQGAYRNKPAPTSVAKNAPPTPPRGTEATAIAPPYGTENPSPVPPHGAIKAVSAGLPVPPHGHPLEKPSADAARARVSGSVASLDPGQSGHKSKKTLPLSLIDQAKTRAGALRLET